MSDTQLRYRTAQTLEFYPSTGRPDSAKVTGYISGAENHGAARLWDETDVVLDTASQSLSSVSQYDTDLTVTSSTGFKAGRRYWIQPTGAKGFEVVLLAVPDSTALVLDAPIHRAVAAGTISSHRLTFDITNTHTGSIRRRCRAEWKLTTDSVSEYRSQYFDIVLLPWGLDVTEADLEDVYPGFGELAGEPATWRKLIAGATRWVRSRILGHDRDARPENVLERDLLKDAAVYRSLAMWAATAEQSTAETMAKQMQAEADESLRMFFESGSAVDTNDDLSVAGVLGYRYLTIEGTDYQVPVRSSVQSELGMPLPYLRVG